MTAILAIDPGADGGAVLLAADGRTAIDAWAWDRRVTGGIHTWRLWRPEGPPLQISSIHEIALQLARAAEGIGTPWQLCVEGLFAWSEQLNGIIELAEATGELLGPLAARASVVHRPRAVTWRAAVLPKGWGRTSEEAEHAARIVARSTVRGLGRFVEYEFDADGREVPLWPHVCEAACMARFGWVAARAAAQQDLIAGRSSGRGR